MEYNKNGGIISKNGVARSAIQVATQFNKKVNNRQALVNDLHMLNMCYAELWKYITFKA